MFLAKSNGETLREHVEKCLRVFQSLYEKYPDLLTEAEWDLLRQAVIAHDLGKINPLFQKLMKEGSLSEKEWNQWMPHGQLSPAMIKKDARTDKIEQIILVCAIYYHHDREKTDPDIMRSYILDVLKPEWEQVEHTCPFLTNRKVRPSYYSNQVQKLDELKDDEILRYILIKGCLNRIDYCASAGRLEIEASSFINGKDVAQCTENFMEKQGYARREMQTYLAQHEGENLIVTASTGSGKTEGALLWMKDSKGFYTLPLKVSINSIWRRIHENMGYKPAVLLHSDAKGFYLTRASDQDKYETARLFAAPLTITTIDQLFQFVYKVNGAEAAASALATARLVIDEIQMYEPELVAIILYGLKMITQMGGKYLIITATFPKILYKVFEEHTIPYQCAPKSYYGDVTKRHWMKLIKDEFPIEEIVRQAETKRVLLLCNTVNYAIELYQQLQEYTDRVGLLHSRFIRKDRKKLEQEILDFAPNDPNRKENHGIWISTQIVEASLNIDFDVLYTEMCSIDSLLQRMGRVYRNRWYDGNGEPNVYVVYGDAVKRRCANIIDPEIYTYTMDTVKAYEDMLLEESEQYDMKTEMIDCVYDPEKNKAIENSRYLKKIKAKWNDLAVMGMYQYNKKDKEAKIRDIRSDTVMPISIYNRLADDGTLEAWEKRAASMDRDAQQQRAKLHEEILSYTVAISRYYADGWQLEHCNLDTIWKHSDIKLCVNRYDEELGLMKGVDSADFIL